RRLAARPRRAQLVEAVAGDRGGQPAARTLDALLVGLVPLDERLLHGVLGVGDRTEHSVGHGEEVGALPRHHLFHVLHGRHHAPRAAAGSSSMAPMGTGAGMETGLKPPTTSAASTAPAKRSPAPAPNARWAPSSCARLLATDTSTARPKAPPTCCDVVSTP